MKSSFEVAFIRLYDNKVLSCLYYGRICFSYPYILSVCPGIGHKTTNILVLWQ